MNEWCRGCGLLIGGIQDGLAGQPTSVGVGVDGSDLGQRAAVGDVDVRSAASASATHTSDVIAGKSYSQAR
jgi:hypothetical protein